MSFPPYPPDPNKNPDNVPGSDPYSAPWPPQYGQGPATPIPPVYRGQNPSTPPPPTSYDPYTQPSYPYPPPGSPPGSYMQPPPPPVTPTSGGAGRKWLLIGLAAIVILAGIGLAIFIPYQKTLMEQANATATASMKATHVAGTVAANNATVTATAFVPTATARAMASATAAVVAANPDPYPPAGTLAVFDPLKSLSGTLPNSGNCTFSDGAYHVTVQQQAYVCFSGSSFSNFALEVEMKIVRGDCGALLFRADSAYNKYYGFEVCQNGNYYAFNDQGSGNYKILQSSTSSAIHNGLNQVNTLAVVANGQRLDLYINNQHITGVTDGTYSNGHFGLYAEAVNNPTDAAFSNLKLWTI